MHALFRRHVADRARARGAPFEMDFDAFLDFTLAWANKAARTHSRKKSRTYIPHKS